jgi:hypothetical protein
MIELKQPKVATAKDAVDHIMTMQAERIVDDGKLRCARAALDFYAQGGQDGGANARIGLELTK